MELTPTKPYLVRAFYEWILNNDLTPHLMVDAEAQGAQIPLEFVTDGQIILNISPMAVKFLDLGNEWVYFNARFGGIPQDIHVPVYAVKAIYAQENGKGMVFAEEENVPPPPTTTPPSDDPGTPPPPSPNKGSKKPPFLRVVK
ncbi:MAG: ClpXP protease specificity-enhancing factor [Gammaproteobacteria bacterium]